MQMQISINLVIRPSKTVTFKIISNMCKLKIRIQHYYPRFYNILGAVQFTL